MIAGCETEWVLCLLSNCDLKAGYIYAQWGSRSIIGVVLVTRLLIGSLTPSLRIHSAASSGHSAPIASNIGNL